MIFWCISQLALWLWNIKDLPEGTRCAFSVLSGIEMIIVTVLVITFACAWLSAEHEFRQELKLKELKNARI